MDHQTLLEIATQVTKLKTWPYFDISHYILMCMAVREDLPGSQQSQSGVHLFSRKHPFACWVSCMLTCFAGSIIANFLLGEAPITPLRHTDQVVLATVVWYAIFFSPFDLIYKILKFLPFKLVICIMKEVLRTKKVHEGVKIALKMYPDAYLIIIAVGVAKGSGSYFLRSLDRLIRGIWTPGSHEMLHPSFTTKACVVASMIFILEKKTDYIQLPHELVYLGVIIFFIYFKLSSLILSIHDPLLPFENLFCAIFMGGMVDALRNAITSSTETMKPKDNDAKDKTAAQKKKD